jgi:hypothetical protein
LRGLTIAADAYEPRLTRIRSKGLRLRSLPLPL